MKVRYSAAEERVIDTGSFFLRGIINTSLLFHKDSIIIQGSSQFLQGIEQDERGTYQC